MAHISSFAQNPFTLGNFGNTCKLNASKIHSRFYVAGAFPMDLP
jgi:hypothetical protein